MGIDLLKTISNMINNATANTAKQTPLEQQAPVANQVSVTPQSVDTSTTTPATTSASDASASEENIFSDTSSLTVITGASPQHPIQRVADKEYLPSADVIPSFKPNSLSNLDIISPEPLT